LQRRGAGFARRQRARYGVTRLPSRHPRDYFKPPMF
jgi:hypothetical protein